MAFHASGASHSNPLARLADGLLNSSRKQDVATASALSEVGFSAEAQAKAASRAAAVTRHVFPGKAVSQCVLQLPSPPSTDASKLQEIPFWALAWFLFPNSPPC